MRAIGILFDTLCRLVTLVITLLMIVMVVVMVSLVALRYGFSYSPSWSEEVTRFSLVWMVMLGGAILVLFEDHLRLDLGDRLLPPIGRKLQRLYIQVVIFVPCAFIAVHSINFAASQTSVMASGIRISLFVPSLAVPVGMILICICSAMVALKIIFTDLLGRADIELPDQRKHMYNVLSAGGNEDF